MYARLSGVLFPIVSLVLLGSVYWGYQEHQEKNSVLLKAENQYQRAFHDLSFHMDQLNEQLGNTLAVNSTSQAYHRKGLVNVWRITSEAQNEINQLPLTLLPFSTTEEFLSKIANFSYRTSVRDLTKQPLTDKEYATLKTLYNNSKDISADLRKMQAKVLQNNLRWMDVELALASERTPSDNTIIDGFKTMDKKVAEYPEIDWGPSVAALYEKRNVRMLTGKKATPQEIAQKAAGFLGLRDPDAVKVTENGKGTEYESYSAVVVAAENDRNVQMEFTKQGGRLIWFMNPRSTGKVQKVSLREAEQEARRFLKGRGYADKEPISYDDADNSVNITYASVQDGVVIYPEKLTVKVALDNGQVVGLQAADFVYEQHARKLPKPGISEAEARKLLNPSFKMAGMRLALIENELREEVLCYEFRGRINGGDYRIFVNADTGIEEKIEHA
ncbi:sporulation protein [Paenibacillus darwinianus]|uniref:Sporulation protein n=1 Tax=Paenibacillus darwinianus TaxID=1380763 RepID=A0A9W5S3R8_9BACL|nr:germination protein YpeB [Paenibacillus darwinianus]EXX91391.1 sporulation protein [Paenibacillus darwinianus]EXX92223.1 sporulation protein [Paenibacillus darwinianus]EXX92336.1 sporulation protein [Paenibacillus darwinianus]